MSTSFDVSLVTRRRIYLILLTHMEVGPVHVPQQVLEEVVRHLM